MVSPHYLIFQAPFDFGLYEAIHPVRLSQIRNVASRPGINGEYNSHITSRSLTGIYDAIGFLERLYRGTAAVNKHFRINSRINSAF